MGKRNNKRTGFVEFKGYLLNYLSLARPKQWIKNLIVFTPILFSGDLFDFSKILIATQSCVVFCLASSSVYFINDLLDYEKDKLHPTKKNRPLASGKVKPEAVFLGALLLAFLSVILSLTWVDSEYISLFVSLYLIIMFSYSLFLKNVPILDAIVVAMGFVIKAVAGSIVIEVPLGSFLIVTIISTALLVSFGKRMAEISSMGLRSSRKHRTALSDYNLPLLNSLMASLTASAFVSYTMFSYSTYYEGPSELLLDVLPPKYRYPQWLMLTIPVVFYCLARYLVIVYKDRKSAGKPESLFWEDKSLLISVIVWGILVVGVIYFSEIIDLFK